MTLSCSCPSWDDSGAQRGCDSHMQCWHFHQFAPSLLARVVPAVARTVSQSCHPPGKTADRHGALLCLSRHACYVGLPGKHQICWANSTQQPCSDQRDRSSAVSTAVRDRLQRAICPGHQQKLKYSAQKG